MPIVLHLSTGKSLRGGENQTIILHKALLSKGITSILLCKSGSELSYRGIPCMIPIPWAGEWDILALRRIIRLGKSQAASIIHCHDAHALSHGSIAGKLLRVPVIYTRRVVFPVHVNLFSAWKYRQCRMVIAISNAVAAQCRSLVDDDRICIIPDSADWTRPVLSRTEARNALKIPDESFVIGSVGHFTREKNLPLIAHLARELERLCPDVRIACIGPIDDKPIDRAPGNLVCTGLKPDAVNFYGAFDAYVSAATHEGLGSALLDAIVRDVPAVAIDGGGTRDLFPEQWPLISADDTVGFITAVRNVIANPSMAREKALACGKRARGIFSPGLVIQRTMDAYRNCLKPANTARMHF
jgi:L-malate glycosyltransferase